MRSLLLLVCAALLPGANLDFQRTFRGDSYTSIHAMTSDHEGNVYVAGTSYSSDLPVRNAAQAQNRGTAVVFSDDDGQTWSPTGHLPEDVAPPLRLPLPAPVLLGAGVSNIYRSLDEGRSWAAAYHLDGGYIDGPVYDTRDPSVVYAPTNLGVLKSADSGLTWTLLTSGLAPGGCCLGSVVSVDPFRAGRLYYSLEGRAYVSQDSGATWSPLTIPDGLRNPRVLADPMIRDAAWMYSYEGLYRSSDGGVSWHSLPIPVAGYLIWIVPHPTVAGRIYARTTGALLRTDDGGATWTVLHPSGVDPKYAVTSLAVAAGKPDCVAVSGTSDSGRNVNLYSRDAGATWSLMGTNRSFWGFSFDPARTARMYASGTATADAFVAKLSASGEIVYLTYLGGQGDDDATQIAVGADGSVFVAGTAQSADFPGSGPRLYKGAWPTLFAAKLDPSGGLVFSALLGNNDRDDSVRAVGGDDGGRLYLAGTRGPAVLFVDRFAADGSTLEYTTDLPVTLSATVVAFAPSGEALVSSGLALTRFDTAGTPLFSTQLPAAPAKVAVDAGGHVYVTAAAYGSPPVTPDAFQKSINGDCPNNSGGLFARPSIERPLWMTDAYVVKLSPNLGTTEFATLLGGSCRDVPTDVAVDSDGSIWIAGETYSDPFPTVDPISGPPPVEMRKPFVAHLDARGSRLIFATYTDTTPPHDRSYSDPPVAAAGTGGSVYIAGSPPRYYGPSGPALLWKISPGPAALFSVTRVANAYSEASQAVAPAEIVRIDVPGLVPAEDIDLGLSPPGGTPLELGGVSVNFDGIPAKLMAVHPDLVYATTPAELAGAANATVQVRTGGTASNPFLVTVRKNDLAFFPQVRNQDGSLNSADNSAPGGSTVSLFVTGAGWPPTTPLRLQFGLSAPYSEVTPAPIPGFVDGLCEIRVAAPSAAGKYDVYVYDPLQGGSFVPTAVTAYVQ